MDKFLKAFLEGQEKIIALLTEIRDGKAAAVVPTAVPGPAAAPPAEVTPPPVVVAETPKAPAATTVTRNTVGLALKALAQKDHDAALAVLNRFNIGPAAGGLAAADPKDYPAIFAAVQAADKPAAPAADLFA